MEVPIRKLLMGWPADKAFSADAMRNPGSMGWFVDFAEKYRAKGEGLYKSLAGR